MVGWLVVVVLLINVEILINILRNMLTFVYKLTVGITSNLNIHWHMRNS